MIYEWIEMAEKDLVAEAHNFRFLIRTDITNFYNSIYTHSIGWALHGREEALNDKDILLTGCKIDKLIQSANDKRTNGIPVGSALSDLIAEIVLARIDRNISIKLNNLDIHFLATRFKDDYRILCDNEGQAKKISKCLADELSAFNLLINEHKTKVYSLPEGLYREHDREYYPLSLRKVNAVPFSRFEHALLKALDIHRHFPGTSLLEKFLSELFNRKHELKIQFSQRPESRKKQLLKVFSLLMLLKRESEKTICLVIAIIAAIYKEYDVEHNLKLILTDLIKAEIVFAADKNSNFELIWLVFLLKHLQLGMTESINKLNADGDPFLRTILTEKQDIFTDAKVQLFVNPSENQSQNLANTFDVFNRSKT